MLVYLWLVSWQQSILLHRLILPENRKIKADVTNYISKV